jgi:hypothetical protein
MKLRHLPLALALTLALATPLAAAAAALPDDVSARALERIAAALERIERGQRFQLWPERAQLDAAALREVERKLDAADDRVEALETEAAHLAATIERIEEAARDPDYPAEQAAAERRQLELRAAQVRAARREAGDRRSELEARLAAAERELADRLADLDRQLRAP